MLFKGLSITPLLALAFAFPAPDISTVSLNRRDGAATSLDFGSSQWIWTGEQAGPGGNAPIGSRAFRKTVTSPEGKCAVCATILIVADNGYTVSVNGAQIGTGGDFHNAQVYTAALQSSSNLFAVSATNTGGPASLIATILIQYTDGTSQTIVTDSTWKTFVGAPPPGYDQPSTDDSAWTAAVVEGGIGVSPWGAVTIPPALDLSASNWIWTSEATSPGANVAPGTRGFRKDIVSPSGKCAVCAKAVISVDNGYTLYWNGESIGSGGNFHNAEYYTMTNLNSDSNVFAVAATNAATSPNPKNPAGVIATILVAYNDGTSQVFTTDTTWKTLAGLPPPPGFELPLIGDLLLFENSVNQGVDGVSPWGVVNVPSA